MSAMRLALPALVGATLTGCGTFVPEIQDFGDAVEGQRFVQAIVTNVTCEVQNAIYDVYTRPPHTTFMDDWGVQMTLSLTVNEKSATNPTVNWFPLSPRTALFNLSAGANLSAEATRIDKMNAYHLVKDLRLHRCPAENRPGGPFLMQSDLKLNQWLFDAISASRTNSVDFGVGGPLKANVLTHQVKFEVITSGNLTPTWKLTRVTVNPSGSFLSANRGRTHELIITLGPADKTVVTQTVRGTSRTFVVAQPSRQAADLHLSSTIGSAVSESLKGALQP
ncbi:MAG: hypothetical protein QOG83_1498 [Alphaproteobacteria bacterium]|nr:hypothetical protein [Alphaproteobacteria bacterium]